MVTLFHVSDDWFEDNVPPEGYRPATNPHQPHCPCGRFAKFVSLRTVYGGAYSVDVLTTRCARCGVQKTNLT